MIFNSCRRMLLSGIAFVFAALIVSALALARTSETKSSVVDSLPKDWNWTSKPQGNTCGLYAVARAFDLMGKQIDNMSIWNTNYMSHGEGSTPTELMKAVSDLGGKGVLTTGLSALELRSLQHPLIANVKGELDRSVYDHWLCVQPHYDSVTVYDGPSAGKSMSYPEFLARWNGIGMIVSQSNFGLLQVFGVRVLGVGMLLFLSAMVLKFFCNGKGAIDCSLPKQFLGVAATTATVFLFGSWMYGTQSIGESHRIAMHDALLPHKFTNTQPELGLTELTHAIDDPSKLLIDARMPADFENGTIGNAVNIPVYADILELTQYMEKISKNTHVVVFCQSQFCGYDTVIAKRLSTIGYSNVSIAAIGYDEYINAQKALPQQNEKAEGDRAL